MHYRCGWKCILADYILISKSSVCFCSLFCTDKKLGSCHSPGNIKMYTVRTRRTRSGDLYVIVLKYEGDNIYMLVINSITGIM